MALLYIIILSVAIIISDTLHHARLAFSVLQYDGLPRMEKDLAAGESWSKYPRFLLTLTSLQWVDSSVA